VTDEASVIATQVRRLELGLRRLVRDVFAGQYGSVFKGRGVEFADLREYQYGDDVRTIDWTVTARSTTTYVRRYVEERELTAVLLIDRSASDMFGSRVRSKARLATEVCAVLALAASRNHDRIGLLTFTDRVEQYLAPGKGRRQARRVLRELVAFQPTGRGTDVDAALRYTDRVLRRRAVVFIVSDFLTPRATYTRALDAVAARHDTIAVQLVDPRERTLPDVGLLTVRDPESGRWRTIDTGSAAVRSDYASRGTRFDDELRRSFERRGVDCIRLETGQSYVAPLVAFFRRRERRQVR
jgi:uncharacterized protein (DUF58 family)